MNNLSLFVKYPAAGEVKSRLGKELGYDTAAGFYKRMAEGVLRGVYPQKTASYQLAICFSPGEKEEQFKQWLGDGLVFCPQKGTTLGERMLHAARSALGAGFLKTIIIGSDCPAVTRELIEDAFALLDSHDVVTGPALDGGYYLIGLKRGHPVLFEGIDWGTSRVYEQTLAAAGRAGLLNAALPVLRDIDTPADLQYYSGLGLI